MQFWDQFVFRVYASFSEDYPPGLQAAGAVLDNAFGRNLLNIGTLNDLSVQLCILACPSGGALYNAALDEFLSRKLPPQRAAAVFVNSCRLRVTDLLGIDTEDDLSRQGLVFQAICWYCASTLCRFLARLTLTDYSDAFAKALIWLSNAFRCLNQGNFVENRANFTGYLYRRVLRRVPRGDVLDAWPTTPPTWEHTIPAEERQFLDCCMGMERTERCLMYLSFFAELNVDQVAFVLRAANPDQWTPQPIQDALRRIWENVLRCMEQP